MHLECMNSIIQYWYLIKDSLKPKFVPFSKPLAMTVHLGICWKYDTQLTAVVPVNQVKFDVGAVWFNLKEVSLYLELLEQQKKLKSKRLKIR